VFLQNVISYFLGIGVLILSASVGFNNIWCLVFPGALIYVAGPVAVAVVAVVVPDVVGGDAVVVVGAALGGATGSIWVLVTIVVPSLDAVAVGAGAAGVDVAGAGAAGVDVAGADAGGVDVAGVDAAGVDVAGVDAAGVDTTGVDVAGVDAAGVDVVVFDAAVVDAAGVEVAVGPSSAKEFKSDAEPPESIDFLAFLLRSSIAVITFRLAPNLFIPIESKSLSVMLKKAVKWSKPLSSKIFTSSVMLYFSAHFLMLLTFAIIFL